MFTGIIKEIGSIKTLRKNNKNMKIGISSSILINEAIEGDSIAVNGICLTLTNKHNRLLNFDVMNQTVKLTNLVNCKINNKVNLEPALKLSDRINGHIVSGHIDTTGKIMGMKRQGEALLIKITYPEEYSKYLIDQGSIAVDGISLTVVKKERFFFSVSIVNFTRENTVLVEKKINDKVNLEFDVIAKYCVEKSELKR